MTDGTTKRYNDGKILFGGRRRRRWTPGEKVRIVEETYFPGTSASPVAHQHGISGCQVFSWRRLVNENAWSPLQLAKKWHRRRSTAPWRRRCASCIGYWQKTRENELLREVISRAAGAKTAAALDLATGRWSVTAVADALGIARPHLSAMRTRPPPRPRGRPPLPDAELVADIRRLAANLPAYGYRRVHALLRGQAEKTRRTSSTAKHVYRVMKMPGLLLQRDGEHCEERRQHGRVPVDQRNTRWCSDGLEIACDNGEKVRVAPSTRTGQAWRPTNATVRRWARCHHRRHHRQGRAGPGGRHRRASLRTRGSSARAN